jgi:hypothetical protein
MKPREPPMTTLPLACTIIGMRVSVLLNTVPSAAVPT